MENAATLIRAIASLAWPFVALAAVIIFREQIRGLLLTVRRLKAGPVEVGFWERRIREVRAEAAVSAPYARRRASPLAEPTEGLQLVADDLAVLAEEKPVDAVLRAHDRVRDELVQILTDADAPDVLRQSKNAVSLAAAAARRGLITDATLFATEGLTTLRNLSLDRPEEVSRDRALSYLVTADAVLYAIRQNAREQRRREPGSDRSD